LAATVPDALRLVLDPTFEGTDEWREKMRLLGNQRHLHEERTKTIGRYIDSLESTFPNSIILAASSSSSSQTLAGQPWFISNQGGTDTLTIPSDPQLASVVDGQHRLYGFLHTEIEARRKFQLVCALFFDIPQSVQAMVFATINTNQKPVRRGMALNLYGYNTDDEDRRVWSPEKLAVFIARRLNFDKEGSRLFHRIKIEAEGAPPPHLLQGASRAVSLAAIVDGVLGLITGDPVKDRDTLRSERFFSRVHRNELGNDSAPLRSWYRASADHLIYELVRAFVGLVDEQIWAHARPRSMLTRAVGIRALFGFLRASLVKTPVPSPDAAAGAGVALLAPLAASLSRTRTVDFADAYFEATGRGQQRILNALLVLAGYETVESVALATDDREQLRRIVGGSSD
jgi:DNA phosphorothioation-associated DGQHR protein 1